MSFFVKMSDGSRRGRDFDDVCRLLAVHEGVTATELGIYESLSNEQFRRLAKVLASNSTLKWLVLSDIGVGVEGCDEIAEALANKSTLTTLNISKNLIGNEGCQAIANSLAKNSTLTKLDMSCNHIDDEGGKAIAEALANNSTLTSLDISNNQIGDEGCMAIAEALANNSTLTSLKMEFNRIGDAGCEALGAALAANSTLEWLSIGLSDEISEDKSVSLLCGLVCNETLQMLECRASHPNSSWFKTILRDNDDPTVLRGLDGDAWAAIFARATTSPFALRAVLNLVAVTVEALKREVELKEACDKCNSAGGVKRKAQHV